jgi:hypothetical protein
MGFVRGYLSRSGNIVNQEENAITDQPQSRREHHNHSSLDELVVATFFALPPPEELKSSLHWGQLQVTKEKERVKRAMLLPVMAYALLLRLYGKEMKPDEGFTIFQLKRRFCEGAWQAQLDLSETEWRKKLDQLRAAA